MTSLARARLHGGDPGTSSDGMGGEGAAHAADLALVRLWLAGDEHAQRELERRLACIRWIVRGLNRRRSNPLSALDLDDVVQEAWMAILKALPRFKGKSKLETWAHSISARVLARSLHARDERLCMLPIELPVDGAANYPGDAKVGLETYLRLLPERQAAVLRLRFVLGLPFRDIARELGISIPSAKTYYRRGIRTLGEFVPPEQEG